MLGGRGGEQSSTFITLSSTVRCSGQDALKSLEWVTNFGLDVDSLKQHPGESAAWLTSYAHFRCCRRRVFSCKSHVGCISRLTASRSPLIAQTESVVKGKRSIADSKCRILALKGSTEYVVSC